MCGGAVRRVPPVPDIDVAVSTRVWVDGMTAQRHVPFLSSLLPRTGSVEDRRRSREVHGTVVPRADDRVLRDSEGLGRAEGDCVRPPGEEEVAGIEGGHFLVLVRLAVADHTVILTLQRVCNLSARRINDGLILVRNNRTVSIRFFVLLPFGLILRGIAGEEGGFPAFLCPLEELIDVDLHHGADLRQDHGGGRGGGERLVPDGSYLR